MIQRRVRTFSSLPLLGALFALLLCIGFSEATVGQCNTLVLFDDALQNGVTFEANTDRASCQIVNDVTAPEGSKVLRFATESWLANSDGCGLIFPSTRNLSLYTEIEFWLRSNTDNKFVTPAMESTGNNVRGVGVSVTGTEWKRYRFPLPQTFDGIDFDQVISAFVLELQLDQGEEILVDLVQLRCRNYFPILTEETVPGREQLQPTEDNQCQIISDSDNTFLRVSPSTWACYLSFTDPRLNLESFGRSIQFRIKSNEKTRVVIQPADGQRHSVDVASTKGEWKLVTIALTKFGDFDLSDVLIPFAIERISSSSSQPEEILISDIHYLLTQPSTPTTPPPPPPPPPSNIVYCNDFEDASKVGLEWSNKNLSMTPVGNRTFLGEFGVEDITLKLTNLGSHHNLTIEFDLYILYTWDGGSGNGPDVWKAYVDPGIVLIRTTFSNDAKPQDTTYYQHYPDGYPGKIRHPGTTGAIERGTLGYPDFSAYRSFGDSVYRLSFTIPHTASSVRIHFASDKRYDQNEAWGLDNICVTKA